jgi:hypothetical protein
VQTALNLTMFVTWYMSAHESVGGDEPAWNTAPVSHVDDDDGTTDANRLDAVEGQQQQESDLRVLEHETTFKLASSADS